MSLTINSKYKYFDSTAQRAGDRRQKFHFCRSPFAVNVMLNLSIIFMWTAEVQIWYTGKVHYCSVDYLISLLSEKQATSLRLQVNCDLMTFGDTLRDGSRLAFMLNISVSLLLVMFKHKGQYFKTNNSVTSSILSWKHTYQLTSDNTCNIWTRMSVYPWFFVNKLRAGNNYYFRSDESK